MIKTAKRQGYKFWVNLWHVGLVWERQEMPERLPKITLTLTLQYPCVKLYMSK